MLYQEYKNKMAKLVRILDFIRRYKALIISVVATIFVLIVSFLATKGILLKSSLASDTIIYGEKIEFSAKSLFSKTNYEYQKEGDSEWTSNEPVNVGKYRVRGVSNSSFGTHRYSDEYEFSIVEREISLEVLEDSIVYGNTPSVKADNAISTDQIECEFFYNDLTQRKTIVYPIEDKIKITNKDGIDVTKSYKITINTNDEIEFIKRPITITVNSVTEIYSGTEVKAEGYIQDGELAFNDKIQVSEYPSHSGTGKIENDPSPIIVITTPDGKNVTENYQINLIKGTIIVNPRPITINTSSAEFTYDDTDHSSEKYEVEASTPLVNGHRIVVSESTKIKYFGTADNVLDILIYDGEGNNVTKNYAITYKNGTLSVNKKSISITTMDASWVYDGTAHTQELYQVKDLIAGHIIKTKEATSVTNFTNGKIENKVEYEIYSDDINVTNSYDITYTYGTVEITKRPISVQSLNESHVYDAEEFGGSLYEIISGTLVVGQEIQPTYTGKITDVGTAKNDFTIEILSLGNKTSDNYEITYSYGTLTVTKRPVVISGQAKEKVYDGTPLTNQAYDLISELDVVSKHTVKYIKYASITNAGYVANEIEIEIYEGEEEKTSNYDISYTQASNLVVHKREITITANSLEEYYDGTTMTNNSYTISDPGIAPNQREVVKVSGGQKNVGSSDNIIVSVEIYDADDNDVYDNYIVHTEKGTLTIIARPITLISDLAIKAYDGIALENHTAIVSPSEGMGLAPNQTITYSFTGIQINVGTSLNSFTAKMWADGLETTSNYDITYKEAELIVTPRLIVLISSDADKIYDGYELIKHEAVIADNAGLGLAPNQTITYNFTGSQTDAGSSRNEFTAQMWAGTEETTSNYEIVYKKGTLRVDKRLIRITTESESKVYDGWELYLPEPMLVVEGDYLPLAPNQSIFVLETTSIINVARVTNETIVSIVDKDLIDRTENYIVKYQYGTLEITIRSITITTGSAKKEYDATPLTSDIYTWNKGPDYGLADGKYGQFIDLKTNGTITYKGTTENTVEYCIIYDADTEVTDNYEITYILGELEITARKITISAQDREKEYDGKPLNGSNPVTIGGGGLADGDSIYATFEGSQTIPGSSPVSIAGYTITRGREDVTYCYEVTGTFDATLTVHKREITIIANSASKIYDAITLTSNGYEKIGGSGLVRGQTLESLKVIGSQTNVGESPNVPSDAKIVDLEGNDVTSYYSITYVNGTLVVFPRPITVVTGGGEKIYDGLPLTNSLAYVSDNEGMGIVNGQTEEITATGYGIDAGEYQNTYDIIIKDANGNDVTFNYEITPSYGILKIIPIDLYFKTLGGEKVYDGYALTNPEYELLGGELLTTHEFESITVTGKQILAGESENTVAVKIIDEFSLEDVTMNYRINLEAGILKVTKRAITIVTGSASKKYDGEKLTCPDCECPEWDTLFNVLAPGHDMKLKTTGEIVEIGIAPNTYELHILYMGEDVTDSFDVTELLGTLEITLPDLVFESDSDEKSYDGLPLECHFARLTEGMLANGHVVGFDFTGSLTNAGEADNIFTVKIYDSNNGSADVTDLYPSITCNPGKLVVTPIEITIKASSAIKQYDGTPLYAPLEVLDPYQHLSSLNLIFDGRERFTWGVLSSAKSITNPGEIQYVISGVDSLGNGEFQIYFDKEPVPMTNFIITCEEGTLRVVEKLLTINLWEIEKEYDGTPLAYENFYWYMEEEEYGLDIYLNLEGSLTDAGSLDNFELAQRMMDEGRVQIYKYGIDVTSNYAIEFVGTPLTVTKRFIEITAGSAQKVDDGKALTDYTFVVSKGSLVDGHEIDLETICFDGFITSVGTAKNSIDPDSIQILDANGNDVTDNYYIVLVDGLLEITKE